MTSSDELLEFVSSVSGDTFLKVEESFGDGYVRLNISEAERRQAKHDIRSVEDIVVELLRNSRDAHARRVFVATGREGDRRTLTVVDDGVGVPSPMADRVFEPRVTSKLDSMVVDQWGVHGRGMALFSIRSNTLEARITTSDLHKGAAVVIVTDTAQLAERADQSTWPVVERDDEGALKVARGPHNIVRRVVEFAAEHPGMELYIGTPTDIVATMSAIARRELDTSELLFCDNLDKLPVWLRCGAAADAGELVDVAESLGIPVSERTAHRVLGGELPVARPVLEIVTTAEKPPAAALGPDIYRDRRGLKIHHTDITMFRAELEKAFDSIAERYYLHLKCEPKITVGKEDIRVRFEVEKED
jgi:Histidine kinase-, DNA gyrase B-, and HSP90-like ATPase